jgi:hypothetical protein
MTTKPSARSSRIVLAILLGAFLAACSTFAPRYAIRAAAVPPQACMDALMSGSLERQPQTGLGIGTSDVDITPVEWPFGYSARVEATGVVLVDEKGNVVAREHDRVNVGGGLGAGEIWFACGPVTVESNVGG